MCLWLSSGTLYSTWMVSLCHDSIAYSHIPKCVSALRPCLLADSREEIRKWYVILVVWSRKTDAYQATNQPTAESALGISHGMEIAMSASVSRFEGRQTSASPFRQCPHMIMILIIQSNHSWYHASLHVLLRKIILFVYFFWITDAFGDNRLKETPARWRP